MRAPYHPPMADRFTLGPWQVNVPLDTVSAAGAEHKLEPRSMRLLVLLAQAGGELVSADALLAGVWPGLVVTPSSLYDAVAQLRKVLGPEHIATVARKGYRLVTPAQWAHAPVPMVQAEQPRLGQRSVAVLPFGAQGLPEALSFLSENLTSGLIAELSRQPGLTVIARGTMLTFGPHAAAPQQVAQTLGVRFVVDGQLEARGDTLHVAVQVVDAWRGTQTWADALNLPSRAWHETAGVVVGRLARALHFELYDLATQPGAAPPADSSGAEVQARALSAQAWVQLFARAQTPETNTRAHRLASQARELAPHLAQAWMCLAYCDWRSGQYRWSDETRAGQFARSLAQAERAIELDPRDPDGHYVLSLPAQFLEQHRRADEALRHCLRLTSSYAPAHGLLAMWCVRRGDVEQARAHCAQAFSLSPLEPLRVIWHAVLAEACLVTGDAQGAFDEAQRGMAVNPAHGQLYMFGAAAAARLGARARAAEWVAVLGRHKASCTLAAVRASLTATYDPAARGQLEQLLGCLADAGLPAG